MQNNIVFNGKNNTSNCLTFKDVNNETFNITFEGYFPESLTINIINSTISIIEFYLGNVSKSNITYNIDENSKLDRFSVIVDNTSNIELIKTIDNKGYYKSMQIDLTNNDVNSTEIINLIKEEASSDVLNSIYSLNDNKKKYQTTINHLIKETKSTIKIYATNNDAAATSIYTDAFIKKGAIGTETMQEGRIINLTDNSSGIVLPNLHIDENDVQASHSCSVGSLNKDHVYYLLSRGLSLKEASKILVMGYFNPLISSIKNEEIKNKIIDVLDKGIR